ncbi:MAG TPA: hypothetical protein VMJ74_09040, partial [Pseudomonadales bacterium]|nr:hypothetical protein [Pseudomonadales bacterium]
MIVSDRGRGWLLLACGVWMIGCGSGGATNSNGGQTAASVTLSAADVTSVIEVASHAVNDTHLA